MVVNPVEMAGNQGMAVATSQGSTGQMMEHMQKVTPKKGPHELETHKVTTKSLVAQLLETKDVKKTAVEILARAAAKLAAAGIDLSPQKFLKKIDHKIKDEYDLLLREGRENFEDKAEINHHQRPVKRKKGQKRGSSNRYMQREAALKLDEEGKDILREYISTFSSFLVNGAEELQKKLKELGKKLKQKGLSDKDINHVEKNLRGVIRTDITAQIKEAFFKKLMSKEKTMDMIVNEKSLQDVVDFAYDNHKLGGPDFGGESEGLKGTVKKVVAETREEVKDFVTHEMENKLMEKHLVKGRADVAKEDMKELLKLGAKVGFDPAEFLRHWEQKKIDLGLVLIDVPPGGPSMLNGGNAQNNGNGPGKQDFEFGREDEREILVNRLRAIYMQRAIHPDTYTLIKTSFKMRRLKNGLLQLGIIQEDFERIEKEARSIAKIKIMEMLKEALLERATLYELDGPAFYLIKRKIKSHLRNAERLGLEINARDFLLLRNNANWDILRMAEKEVAETMITMKINDHPIFPEKRDKFLAVIARLRDEIGLPKEMTDNEINSLVTREEKDLAEIEEAA